MKVTFIQLYRRKPTLLSSKMASFLFIEGFSSWGSLISYLKLKQLTGFFAINVFYFILHICSQSCPSIKINYVQRSQGNWCFIVDSNVKSTFVWYLTIWIKFSAFEIKFQLNIFNKKIVKVKVTHFLKSILLIIIIIIDTLIQQHLRQGVYWEFENTPIKGSLRELKELLLQD